MSPAVGLCCPQRSVFLYSVQDNFVYPELQPGSKHSPPASLHDYRTYPSVQVFHRQFLAPADAPKSKPFPYEVSYEFQ